MEKVSIVRDLPGVWRRLELLERIYGRFPSADRLDCFVGVPNLGKGYIERATIGTKTALNRTKSVKNHTAHKKSNARVQVSSFYCNSTVNFSFFSALFLSPYKPL